MSEGNDDNGIFPCFAVLEIMGHRRLAGKVSEQEIAGGAFLRIDIPGAEGEVAATQFYSAASIYCLTPTTEEIARAFGARHQPAPVTQWELPRLTAPASEPADNADDDGDPYDRVPF